MKKSYPSLTYQEFGPMFTAEFFDPKDWAKLFAKSGAKFVTLELRFNLFMILKSFYFF